MVKPKRAAVSEWGELEISALPRRDQQQNLPMRASYNLNKSVKNCLGMAGKSKHISFLEKCNFNLGFKAFPQVIPHRT